MITVDDGCVNWFTWTPVADLGDVVRACPLLTLIPCEIKIWAIEHRFLLNYLWMPYFFSLPASGRFRVKPLELTSGIPTDLPPSTSLNDFLRNNANLKGTKYFCKEGGCGACTVSVTTMDPFSRLHVTKAVNSCLVPIYSCDGWSIKTVEGIGNKTDGYHPIQKRLADFNGTQCGYCSPGMVMNMYSLLESNPNLKMEDVERSFDGNICRCTGYRPILDAFKSFASDATPELKKKVGDIEDVLKDAVCPKTMTACQGKLEGKPCTPLTCSGPPRLPAALQLDLKSGEWIRPTSLEDVKAFLSKASGKIRFVVGNTGRGVHRDVAEGDTYIDLNQVPELFAISTSNGLSIGAGVSLTKTIETLKNVSVTETSYKYVTALAEHLGRVANVPVRNSGSVGGNLMLKHAHHEFQSDLFTIFEAVGASVVLAGPDGEKQIPLNALLCEDMNKKVIRSVSLPPLSPDIRIRTFKITPRLQNAHAYVNAAFVADVDGAEALLKGRPSIVFGGIQLKDGFEQVHAKETEEFLTGKKLTEESVVQEALAVLGGELKESKTDVEASFSYRARLAQGLLYKFILGVLGDAVPEKLRSGATNLSREISSGKQEITSDPKDYPISKPIPKIEAWNQTAGEAQYTNDIPLLPGELHAVFVLASYGRAKLKSIDASQALAMPGVAGFFSAKDIPGANDFMQGEGVEEAPQRIVGEMEFGSQHHFYLETQVCVCRPTEDGIDVFAATQWIDKVQLAVSSILNIPENSVNVVVRRCGGAYGGKITRPNQISAATALAAYKLRKPVRMALDMETNLAIIGKRTAYIVKYQAGFEDDGKLRAVKAKIYGDVGHSVNESPITFGLSMAQNCYFSPKWNYMPVAVLTNTPSNTWTRSPGTTEGIAIIEHIVEHIAFKLKKNPFEVKQVNFIKEGELDMNGSPAEPNGLPEMVEIFKKSAELEKRMSEIQAYNEANVWKKRGLSVVPMKYPCGYPPFFRFAVSVSVFHDDGTVTVSHGGCEMGQGLNTKVAQVAAKTLGVPMDKVMIRPSDSFTNANSAVTGGSMGSEMCCYGTQEACKDLLNRMQPVKAKENKDLTWVEWVAKSFNAGIDLRATYYSVGGNPDLKPYIVYGLACTEVEIDVITGEKQVLRADILEDVGVSLSPEVDIGQLEGSFVMGLGYWLQEEIKYNPRTGEHLTNRTWEYKPPLCKDIPIDFRVSFLQNSENPFGFRRSKATGEPALCMSVCSLFAVKQAVQATRNDKNITDWWNLSGPATTEKIALATPAPLCVAEMLRVLALLPLVFLPAFYPIGFFTAEKFKFDSLDGIYEPNEALKNPNIKLSEILNGPESFAMRDNDPWIYTGIAGGSIIKFHPNTFEYETVAKSQDPGCSGTWDHRCGRPLGLRFRGDKLLVADANRGLLSVNVDDGTVEILVSSSTMVEGSPLVLVNDLDVDSNGDVYFSQSSLDVPLDFGMFTLFASGSGRLLKLDAETGEVSVLLTGLYFANGVQLSKDRSFVLVADCFRGKIVRYNLNREQGSPGVVETFIEGIPGAVDNIRASGNKKGGFLVAIPFVFNPKNFNPIDSLSEYPLTRSMIARLLYMIRLPFDFITELFPNPVTGVIRSAIGGFGLNDYFTKVKHGMVVELSESGEVLRTLHTVDGNYTHISCAFPARDGKRLILGSYADKGVAFVSLKK
ncbi:unnamed protein product [Notodromas monacha]|uniref:Aldehyde oxidase n=1 Tax=Notodromas monacha TaxID=399045 RepID=A0A7R9BH48_9CRUS|nr:unnamed protein product [Notodromas monacha]CAG0914560.1 unnamed protein product [Notodromas monacha]